MNIVKKSLKSLEFDKILAKLTGFSKFEQSKNLCHNLTPLLDPLEIQNQLDFTEESKYILDRGLELPLDFVGFKPESFLAAGISYLSEQELFDFAKTIRTSRLVRNFLKEHSKDGGLLQSLSVGLFSDKDLEDKIFDTFDSALRVKMDASLELKALCDALRDTEANLKSKVNELLNSPVFSKHLQEQIYTTRDDRIVFQVRASSKSKVEGIMHDVSASSQTFYIEPKAIVPLNNKVRELKIKIQSEIIRILTDLTKLVKKNHEEVSCAVGLLAEIDFHFAKARYAVSIKAIKPELAIGKYLKFDKMRHPLLAEYSKNVVENDFEIGKDYKSVIITGSNTGGKTVTAKTVGLFILMCKSGLFLPCLDAKLYPFSSVLADIGDEQNIAQSLSTFSSHMKNIIDILNESDENTFVIMDEICAGTDPQEGAVLAEVILERLAQKKVLSCITTHYGELKALEFSDSYFKNASVEFDTASLKPTYKLLIGIPGLSNAITVSSALGLDSDLVEKAKNIVISQKDPSIVVIEKLQEAQQSLSKNLVQAEEAKANYEKLELEYEKNVSEVKKDKKRVLKNLNLKFSDELDKAKSEIKDILAELRKDKSEKIARRSYARLARLENAFRSSVEGENVAEKYQEINWSEVKPGDKFLVKELHQVVEVLSMPDKNDNVSVQMGMLKTKISKDKLAIYDSKYLSKPVLRFQKQTPFELKRSDMSNTLDLRGYRVEEGLDSLEFFLDKASLANLSPVYVIHGHGSGALKSAVRDFLSTSPYVAKFRFGESAEGGDGVSVIDIN